MTYSKSAFGKGLAELVSGGYDIRSISRWAFEKYLDHANELEQGLKTEMMTIIMMEEGPEFELSREDLDKLIVRMIEN